MAVTAGQQPRKKKSALSSPVTWVIVLGVALAGGAFLLYRQRKSAAAATTTTTTTPDTEDFRGQIATLQAEVADLQSTFRQDEGTEAGTGTGTGGGGTGGGGGGGTGGGGGGGTGAVLAAPGSMSVTPSPGHADLSWSPVQGARVYELAIRGAGGAGTGTSHYDHVGAGTHASVALARGKYIAQARAGRSVTDVHGHWSAPHPFTVPRTSAAPHGGKPGGPGTPPPHP